MTRKTRKTIVRTIATTAGLLATAAVVRGLGPEVYRYFRIRRM
jgi:hypothetical protein